MRKHLTSKEAFEIVVEYIESKNITCLNSKELRAALKNVFKNKYPAYESKESFLPQLKEILGNRLNNLTSETDAYDVCNWLQPLFTKTKPTGKFLMLVNQHQALITIAISFMTLVVTILK